MAKYTAARVIPGVTPKSHVLIANIRYRDITKR